MSSPKLLPVKMSQMINAENKKLMRLNIIRHRQKLLKYLDTIHDTVLRPKIKLNATDLEIIKNEEPTLIDNVKKELIEDKCDNENDDVSVGSNENWDNELTDGTDINSRRSILIKTVEHISKNKSQKDYEYNLGDDIDNVNIQRNGGKRRKRGKYIRIKKYIKPIDRIYNNAKLRAGRRRISNLVLNLYNCCSSVDSTKRIPSTQNILKAANKECKLLVECDKKLIAEKKEWQICNDMLRIKLRTLSCLINLQDG